MSVRSSPASSPSAATCAIGSRFSWQDRAATAAAPAPPCSSRCPRAGPETAARPSERDGAGLAWLFSSDCLGLPSDTRRPRRAAPQPPASPGNELLAVVVVVVAVAEIEHVEQ